jgi:protein-disulfide isomerase
MSRRAFAWTLAGAAFLSGCANPKAEPSSNTPSAETDEVVAEVGSARITLADVDRRVSGQVRRQEWEIRQAALDRMIREKLLDEEAASRGTTVPELLRREVDEKVLAPTPQEVDAVYTRFKSQLGGRSRDQVAGEIESRLRQERADSRREEYIESLRKKAGVKNLLAPYRVELAVPADAPAVGPQAAPVTIVQFSDYQCSYCQRAEAAIEEILKRNEGKVRLIHRDFPLEFHARARPASRAAYCAGEQGRFWEYHRSLLGRPGDLTEAELGRRAAALGLDQTRFGACLQSDRHDQKIEHGQRQGIDLGVTGTPTFFINGRMIVGARPAAELQEVVDAELRRASR